MIRKIAIFNSFHFHYEIFGFIIEYAKSYGDHLDIYTETRDHQGWFDYYRNQMGFDNFYPFNEFSKNCHQYHIIVLTTDDDPGYKPEIYEKYNLLDRTICINHQIYKRRTDIKYQLDIRPYSFKPNRKFCMPIFDIIKVPKVREEGPLKIFISGRDPTSYDLDILAKLAETNKIYVVGRCIHEAYKGLKNAYFYEGINTDKMLNILSSCDYLYYILSPTSGMRDIQLSGFLFLAFGCGIPILTTPRDNLTYQFKSCSYYGEELIPKFSEVIEERKRFKNLRSIFDEYFPLTLKSKEEYNFQIPRKLHLMWLSKSGDDSPPPKQYDKNIQTFRNCNPDWEIIIWNNSMVEKLIKENYPTHFWDGYKSFGTVIGRCDFSRFCVLYLHGGVYSDVDFYCMRSLDDLIDGKTHILVEEVPEHEKDHKNLYNGFLAAIPRFELFYSWLEEMMKNVKIHGSENISVTTSPEAFYIFWSQRDFKNTIELTDTCLVSPYTDRHVISKLCMDGTPMYTYTLWTEGSGWGLPRDLGNENSDQNRNYIFIGLILVLIVINIYFILNL